MTLDLFLSLKIYNVFSMTSHSNRQQHYNLSELSIGFREKAPAGNEGGTAKWN